MVKEVQKGDKNLYRCPECGFWYDEKEWAEKCEQWCREYKSCNLEITRHAIKKGHQGLLK
jgi:predicted ATP-dependent serine protease